MKIEARSFSLGDLRAASAVAGPKKLFLADPFSPDCHVEVAGPFESGTHAEAWRAESGRQGIWVPVNASSAEDAAIMARERADQIAREDGGVFGVVPGGKARV